MVIGFFPSYVQVKRGQTVVFHLGGQDAHTVSLGSEVGLQTPIVQYTGDPPSFLGFLIPTPITGPYVFDGFSTVNSGVLQSPGPSTEVTFAVLIDAPPGIYRYRCSIHPLMVGFIEVVNGPTQPQPPPFVRWSKDMIDLMTFQTTISYWAAVTENSNLNNNPTAFGVPFIDSSGNPLSGPFAYVTAGTQYGQSAVYAYIPSVLSVAAGTTVRFVNRDAYVPHTITMGGDDGTLGAVPAGVSPVGATVYTTGFFNSGWLAPAWIPGTFSFIDITFPNPGVYPIHCELHDTLGMLMTLTVV